MEVKFELVRFGEVRNSNKSERLLKENVSFLKKRILLFLEDISLRDEIGIVIIIPAKGYDIKFSLDDIRNENIKEKLKQNFSESIYNGSYSKILDNLENSLFSPLL